MNEVFNSIIIKIDGVSTEIDEEAKNKHHEIFVNNTTYNTQFNEFRLFGEKRNNQHFVLHGIFICLHHSDAFHFT